MLRCFGISRHVLRTALEGNNTTSARSQRRILPALSFKSTACWPWLAATQERTISQGPAYVTGKYPRVTCAVSSKTQDPAVQCSRTEELLPLRTIMDLFGQGTTSPSRPPDLGGRLPRHLTRTGAAAVVFFRHDQPEFLSAHPPT